MFPFRVVGYRLLKLGCHYLPFYWVEVTKLQIILFRFKLTTNTIEFQWMYFSLIWNLVIKQLGICSTALINSFSKPGLNFIIVFPINMDGLINTVSYRFNRIIRSLIHPLPFPVTDVFPESNGIEFFSGFQ
jgi:hypothetical protein